jgi:hypothetical protein
MDPYRGGHMKFCLILGLLVWALLASPALAEYNTLDELAKAYSDETCKACHSKVYEEWKSSYHSHSVVNSLGILREFIVSVDKDWRQPMSKKHLMRCMECHAPQLKDASESLVKEIVQLISAALDGKDKTKSEEAKKLLDGLNVNCVICHNAKIALEKNLTGGPKKGVYYGPSGKPSPAHGTEKSRAIQSTLFCGQCHGTYTAPDGEMVFCSSLYESYQDAYRSRGGTATCRDCHMRAKDRGHRMPGGNDPETVRESVGVDVQVVGVKVQPDQWIPAVGVTVRLTNRAGHRIPDG